MSDIIISASSLKTFLSCPTRFKLNKVYKPRIFKPYLSIGTLVHKTLHKYYSGMEDMDSIYKWIDEQAQLEIDKLDGFLKETVSIDKLTASLMKAVAISKGILLTNPMEGYHPKKESLEKEFLFPIEKIGSYNILIKGIIDGILLDKFDNYVVFEYKTTSNMKDYTDDTYITTQLQTAIYYRIINSYMKFFSIDRPLSGVKYFVFKTPQIRQTKKETIDAYYNRIMSEYALKKNDYLYISSIVTPNIDKVSKQLRKIFEYIIWCYETDNFHTNPSACMNRGLKCDFIPICYQQMGCDRMFVKREQHNDSKD